MEETDYAQDTVMSEVNIGEANLDSPLRYRSNKKAKENSKITITQETPKFNQIE